VKEVVSGIASRTPSPLNSHSIFAIGEILIGDPLFVKVASAPLFAPYGKTRVAERCGLLDETS
jgi:hypothetical protein